MTEIEEILVSIMPALTAVLSMVAMCVPILSKFANLIKGVKSVTNVDDVKKELKELKVYLEALAQENTQLKKKLNETLTKIDHVARPDDTNSTEVK